MQSIAADACVRHLQSRGCLVTKRRSAITSRAGSLRGLPVPSASGFHASLLRGVRTLRHEPTADYGLYRSFLTMNLVVIQYIVQLYQ